MLTVFHARLPTFGYGEAPAWPAAYEKVAEVEATNLDDAYQLTNNIDSDWTTNAGVRAEPGRFRSTSVGDVIVDGEGRAWRCEPVGWAEISKEEPSQ